MSANHSDGDVSALRRLLAVFASRTTNRPQIDDLQEQLTIISGTIDLTSQMKSDLLSFAIRRLAAVKDKRLHEQGFVLAERAALEDVHADINEYGFERYPEQYSRIILNPGDKITR